MMIPQYSGCISYHVPTLNDHSFVPIENNITYPSLSGICAFIAVTLGSFHLSDQNGEGGVLTPFYPGKINSSREHSNFYHLLLVPNLVCDVVYYHVIN
jgi:hypothetical protein